MMRRSVLNLCTSAVLTMLVIGCGAQELTRDRLGRDVKLKIVVDKVMQPEAGWHTEQWMVREAADAGFNVFCPRRARDLEEVARVTRWCEEEGILHIPWMRGTLKAALDDPAADGKRMVWASGLEDELWSPNSDELWEWMTDQIVSYAQISAEMPTLFGVFLDYENYAKGPNCYALSYDDIIMSRFAEEQGIELPDLALDARAGWLTEQGLHDAFEAFQLEHWRERCRALREAVDEYDPQFQFCIYPAPGTRLMREAAFGEWTSEQAPVIWADAVTYGRRTSFLPQSGALQQGRRLLTQRMETIAEPGLPFIYAGGIDPVVSGADPEYCGRNAVMISDVTDGYWIFYEGPEYADDHPDYFHWFSWANAAIDARELGRWQESRQTPDPWAFGGIGTEDGGLSAPEPSGEPVELPQVKLRRSNMLLVNAAAGQPVELGVIIGRVGDAEADLTWSAHDLSWETVAEGTVPFGAGTISFTPEQAGIHALSLVAGSSSYALTSANVPVGIYGGRGLGIIGAAERLYFDVPGGTEQFTIGVRGFRQETARVNIYDPTGEMVATGQTTPHEERAAVEVEVGEHAGETWALEITRADTGLTLEDVHLSMGDELPPVVSLIPEHVFEAR